MTWLFSKAMMDYVNSLSSPERVEEYSAGTSLAGEPSSQLNVMPTQHKFWRQDKTIEACDLSRFGLTLQLLTASHGEEILTSYRQDSPAKTSVSLVEEKGLKDSEAGSGNMYPASFAKLAHGESGWRTHQLSLLGGWESFSQTWPRWGLMLSGECWELDISGLCIYENESGSLLPTIGKNEFKGASKQRFKGSKEFRGAKMVEGLRTCSTDPIYLTPSFAEIAMGWPFMWTELAPLEMGSFQQWQQQHGEF